MESKEVELIEIESRMVVARGWELGEMGRCWPKGTDCQLYPGDVMYSVVTIVNNTVLYT